LKGTSKNPKKSEGAQEKTIASFRSDLEETREKRARDLEGLERDKDREREEERRGLSAKNRDNLEKLQKDYEDCVARLEDQVKSKETQVEGLSARLTEAERESSRINEGKDSSIVELRGQIERQRKQIESSGKIQSESEEGLGRKEQRETEESEKREAANEQRIRVLETDHQQIVKEYQAKNDVLSCEKKKVSSNLDALSARCDEQIEIATAAVKAGETREKALRKESDRLSEELQRNWILAKLAKLAVDGAAEENKSLLEENRELWNENEELKDELDTVSSGIADLLEKEKNQTSSWQRLRSRLSRRR